MTVTKNSHCQSANSWVMIVIIRIFSILITDYEKSWGQGFLQVDFYIIREISLPLDPYAANNN